MEPRIQYARSVDGASIAFWALGDGPPVVQLPYVPFSHIQMEWNDPDWNVWYRRFSSDFRLIRYDARGCGLSSSPEPLFPLDLMVRDLCAVADKADCERMALIAPVQSAPVAAAFAARYPERVSRIIFWCGISRGDEIRTSSFEALREVSHTDWDLFAETAAHAIVAGWDEAEVAHRTAAIMREACSAAVLEAMLNGFLAEDVSAELHRVECPALVAYRMNGTSPLPSSARYLASAIRGASLQPFPGSSLLFVASGTEPIAAAFKEFLLAEAEGANGPVSGFQTLLYTDIEGHSAIISHLGDERGRAVLREHERVTREAIRAHLGTEVLTRGDGFLVRFTTAQDALECAVDLQRALADASAELPVELRVRVGINAGEPIREGDELHGAAVKATEFIAGQAEGGEVLVANVVRELAAGKSFAFADRGQSPVLGLEEPVRLWELLWAHAAT